MAAKCQYPNGGDREKGTLVHCNAPATHYFDFSVHDAEGNTNITSHRVVCMFHSSDPLSLMGNRKALLIGQGSK